MYDLIPPINRGTVVHPVKVALKRLNLDNIDQQASLFLYLLNKVRFEVALTYNSLSSSMASNHPLKDIQNKLESNYPALENDMRALDAILRKIDSSSPLVSYTDDSMAVINHISNNMRIVKSGTHNDKPLLVTLSRSIILINIIFKDLNKLEQVFIGMCERVKIDYNVLLHWSEDDIPAIVQDS